MATPKKPNGSGKKKGRDRANQINQEDCLEFFQRIDEIEKRMASDAADGRSDINVIYDEMVDKLDCTKEAAKLLQSRRRIERLDNKAKKLDPADRRSLELFAQAMKDTEAGQFAQEFLDTMEGTATPQSSTEAGADA